MATYNFTVRAEDDRGAFSDRTFNIEVENNLVDRMLMLIGDHAYASVNGKDFVERTGKGGRHAHYLLNKWVVVQDDSTYRISNDTINWTENLSFSAKYDFGEEIGELDVPFRCEHSTYFEHEGTVYVLAQFLSQSGMPTEFRNRAIIAKTTDFLSWEFIPESLNLGDVGVGTSQLLRVSNIIRYDNKFLMFYNANASGTNGRIEFISTTDFKTFETHSITNKSQITYLPATTPTFSGIRIGTVNSVVFVHLESGIRSTISNHSGRITYRRNMFITTDLNNLTVPTADGLFALNTTSSGITDSSAFNDMINKTARAPLYFNGHMYFPTNRNGIIDMSVPLTPKVVHYSNNGSGVSGTPIFGHTNIGTRLEVFDGELVGFSSGLGVNQTAHRLFCKFNPTTLENELIPTTGLPSVAEQITIHDFAVRGM